MIMIRDRRLHGSSGIPVELTPREAEVLAQVADGLRNREIALQLGVSIKTVEFHLGNIFGKLCTRSRTEAVVRAWRSGVLAPEGDGAPPSRG
jgi:DNA-binding NarL/FixJ family response regulator